VLQIAAQFAGQLTNLLEIGRSVGLDHKTADHYVRYWSSSISSNAFSRGFATSCRASQDTEAHFIDSGR